MGRTVVESNGTQPETSVNKDCRPLKSLHKTKITHLPPELLALIFSKVDQFRSLLSIRLCCRRFYEIVVHNHVNLPVYHCYRLVFGSTQIASEYYSSRDLASQSVSDLSNARSSHSHSLGKRFFQRVFSRQSAEIDGNHTSVTQSYKKSFAPIASSKVRIVPRVSRSHERHFYADFMNSNANIDLLIPNLRHVQSECLLLEHDWVEGIDSLLRELCAMRQLTPTNVTFRYAECSKLSEGQLREFMGTFSQSIENLKLFSLIGAGKRDIVTDEVIMAAGALRRLTITERVTHTVNEHTSNDRMLLYPRITDRLLYHLANQSRQSTQFEMVNLFSCNIRNEGVVALIKSWDDSARIGKRASASIVLNSCPVDKYNIMRLCEQQAINGVQDKAATFGSPSSGGSLVLHSASNLSSLHVYYYTDSHLQVEQHLLPVMNHEHNENQVLQSIGLAVRRKLGMRFDS